MSMVGKQNFNKENQSMILLLVKRIKSLSREMVAMGVMIDFVIFMVTL